METGAIGALQSSDRLRLMREIELQGGRTLHVSEAHHLPDEAGAVVWDAALCLTHYLRRECDRRWLHPVLCVFSRSSCSLASLAIPCSALLAPGRSAP